jgi:membrane protein implicated in regulation of membrane protease activity
LTRWQSAVALLAIGALVSTACAATRIDRILADPSRFKDRQVRVSGSVVDSYSVTNRGVYRVGDESGQLWVVSDKGVPRKGARVTVQGTIREGFNLGSLGNLINLPAIGSGLVLMESSHKAGK